MNSPTALHEAPKLAADGESRVRSEALKSDELCLMNAYWRASNYLSVGQIYLYDNPLLREPLTLAHVKPLVVGHWGTTPGQNFIYVHLNRVIKKYDLDMFYVAGPGHGGPAIVGQTYLEGTWSEVYPNVTQDEAGLKSCSRSSRFPVVSPAMWRRRRRGRFMKVASWGIRLAMPSEPRSTIPV